MEECPITDKGETSETIEFNTIQIEQDESKYELNIQKKDDMIKFSIIDKSIFPSVNYIRKMNFKEIRELNKIFNLLNTLNEFYDYLKALSENKKLTVKKRNDRISIIFYVEILLKQQEIVIDLFPIKKDIDSSINEIYQELFNLNHQFNNLKNENNAMSSKIIIKTITYISI